MAGRGTFVWASGERYDGEWKGSKENGRGTFTKADGSYFDGFWRDGQKHGVGLFCPPSAAAEARRAARAQLGSTVSASRPGEAGRPLGGGDASPPRAGSPGKGADHPAPSEDVMLREYKECAARPSSGCARAALLQAWRAPAEPRCPPGAVRSGVLVREELVPQTERPRVDPVAGPAAKKTSKARAGPRHRRGTRLPRPPPVSCGR